MSEEHEEEIVVALTPYLVAFPQSKMTDEGLVIYAKALSSLSVEEINAAMMKLLWTLKFFPTVAEIFEAAKSVREYAEDSALPTAADAWGEVMGLARKCGLYQAWEYSCPEVMATVERFGRREICMMEERDVNTARAQFMRMYDTIVRRKEDNRENKTVLEMLPNVRKALMRGKVAEIMEAKA